MTTASGDVVSRAEPVFDTAVTLTGPWRQPRQMLHEQRYGGHGSIHDSANAATLGFSGAPIEGPTHFSQFVPLLATVWGRAWFERSCVSVHYAAAVTDGEEVQASVTVPHEGSSAADIEMRKTDGTIVLVGTASVGPDHPQTEAERRLAATRPPSRLVILDQLRLGQSSAQPEHVRMGPRDHLGEFYPFTLEEKLAEITEPVRWYLPDGGGSPWGRAVIPLEMVSVLTNATIAEKAGFAIRQPAIGLFLDQEIRLLDGPILIDTEYVIERQIIALGESRRTESFWVRSDVRAADTGAVVARTLLHQGLLKDSYPHYGTS